MPAKREILSTRRVTLKDVARKAGVGTATVDRVLNERENVSDAVRKKVLDAARDLKLKRILPSSHHRLVRVEVMLARPELPLIARMNREFERLAPDLDRSVQVHRSLFRDEDPRTLATALSRSRCDGVIVYARDHPLVNDAIDALAKRGIKVVTMISDLPLSRRIAYAGMNHYRAGRTAGALLARMVGRGGSLVILCSHRQIQAHKARIRGVDDYLHEHAADLPIARIVEGGDERQRSARVLREAFADIPEAAAVYNVGAANRGVAEAIAAHRPDRRPVFVGHELTRYSARLLREGIMTVAIDQAPEMQARFAIAVLLRELGFDDEHGPDPPYRSPVPILLYTAENIPEGFRD